MISIHAPHAGRDPDVTIPVATGGISIHAPHAGRDRCHTAPWGPWCHFNPRAPCGARRHRLDCRRTAPPFQSTRPMRGATQRLSGLPGAGQYFNPRAPCGARRATRLFYLCISLISIHAPHAGRDLSDRYINPIVFNFNPRAPCGARLRNMMSIRSMISFQSTRPMRGATNCL